MLEKEKKAKEFLEWIADETNSKEMKKALAKNITFNKDIFEDVYQDSIIKVYNSIMNGNEVNDFRNYMFITLKFNYIQKDNQIKNRQKVVLSLTQEANYDFIDDSNIDDEAYRDMATTKALTDIKTILAKQFSISETDLFIQYLKLKHNKYNLGYKELSEITGYNIKYLSHLIPNMKKWIRENDEAINIRKKLIDNGIY